ncbi:GNAT family N-acetyltransferase [Loigolactobacillus rennini]|uniref:GNAT family N-acetyltransferase n=2 Tax=Loigolactobacillus rennini TaxID=238013 RepID=A0A0R2DFF0_9LACO|nr:GNAT family N-acetyltransferase [Loigolactobacillus rennini]KRM98803.1 GNAT family N-acetyltransferase [Loigolactobacillus rennini DSM 20253]SFZ87669.1 Acetyltransferase (GNAT family) SAS0976 [Loigolactobacillus rennini]
MIRPAEKKDAAAVIPLINMVLEEMELPILKQVTQQNLFKVLIKAFQTEDYRYSYRHGIVDEQQGRIVGIAFGYPESAEAHIDDALTPLLPEMGVSTDERLFKEKEAYPGEWYLDTLSVAPDCQHQGIGQNLLAALPAIAQTAKLNKIGLNVDVANPKAQRLYTKMGYQEVGRVQLAGHEYKHLQLTV